MTRPKPPKPADILLVEDEAAAAQQAAELLRGEGHAVRVARSAREARAEIASRVPQLLVLDLTLETDGLELLQALRFSANDPPGGIVVLAEASDTRSRERAQQLGAAAVLSKPVRGSDLVLCVGELATWL